ncbi:MAG: hypothetical protein ABJN84_10085 [Flavobacteriaceae bacterium]
MNRWHIKFIILLLGLAVSIFWSSCRSDFDYVPNTGNLQFSKDTVFLDTVFSNIGSSTYTLKVYNKANEDILIPFIGLESGQNSSYRLNVDGLAGKEFENTPLLSKDSLFVFIETTFDISTTPENEFLYTEALVFGHGDNAQEVQLVTLIKDAVFLYPGNLGNGTKESLLLETDEDGNEIRVDGFFLDQNELQFTNEKPYVIYGYAAVPEDETLVMDAGTRVHFHQNSGIMVSPGASMHVNGLLSNNQDLLENEVVFEGDRLEPTYAKEPGQWGAIWLRAGSTNNHMDHLTIKNATIGIRADGDGLLESETLTLKNTQIHNSLNFNLLATGASIEAENCVLGSAGSNSFLVSLGGKYKFTHCTLANYWSHGFRSGTTLALNNFAQSDTGAIVTESLIYADFVNCIIYGTQNLELSLGADAASSLNFSFSNCLLKFNDTSGQFENNPLYDFNNNTFYRNNILNQDPDFSAPFNDQFILGQLSAALDIGNPNIFPPVPTDILGTDRTSSPDIGAYETVIFN